MSTRIRRRERMLNKRVVQVPLPGKAVQLLRSAAANVPGLSAKGDAAIVRYLLAQSPLMQTAAFKRQIGIQELNELLNDYQTTRRTDVQYCAYCAGCGSVAYRDRHQQVTVTCSHCQGTGIVHEPAK